MFSDDEIKVVRHGSIGNTFCVMWFSDAIGEERLSPWFSFRSEAEQWLNDYNNKQFELIVFKEANELIKELQKGIDMIGDAEVVLENGDNAAELLYDPNTMQYNLISEEFLTHAKNSPEHKVY